MTTFQLLARSGTARAGLLETPHGAVETPAFMPVATQASVKSLTPAEVMATGTRMLIMNTYHLWLRPEPEVISRHGSLHGFSRWPHAIATDSGGFQAFSLSERVVLSEEGFEFSSHLDGQRKLLSPEESMRVQGLLGSDVALQLDVCPGAEASRDELECAVERTTRWARRCLAARAPGQALFGIVQGGLDTELRKRHADALSALTLDGVGLDGLALGGFSVGEPLDAMHAVLRSVAPALDPARPRYLMGVGTPSDLISAIGAGIDLFDCVLPTRNARNGQAFTRRGKLVIKNAAHRSDPRPLDAGCECPVCAEGYSRSYLRHLFMAGELLVLRLLSLHNLWFYAELVREARKAVVAGEYAAWAQETLARLSVQSGSSPKVGDVAGPTVGEL